MVLNNTIKTKVNAAIFTQPDLTLAQNLGLPPSLLARIKNLPADLSFDRNPSNISYSTAKSNLAIELSTIESITSCQQIANILGIASDSDAEGILTSYLRGDYGPTDLSTRIRVCLLLSGHILHGCRELISQHADDGKTFRRRAFGHLQQEIIDDLEDAHEIISIELRGIEAKYFLLLHQFNSFNRSHP